MELLELLGTKEEVKKFTQGRTANKWGEWDSSLGRDSSQVHAI